MTWISSKEICYTPKKFKLKLYIAVSRTHVNGGLFWRSWDRTQNYNMPIFEKVICFFSLVHWFLLITASSIHVLGISAFLCVWLSVCPSAYSELHMRIQQLPIFVRMTVGRSLILLWQHCMREVGLHPVLWGTSCLCIMLGVGDAKKAYTRSGLTKGLHHT